MNSAIEDIKDILEASTDLTLVFNTDLFLYKEPARPDNCVTLFDAPGRGPLPVLNANMDTKPYERPSIQIRVRNKDAQVAMELAYKIQTVLHGVSNETWGLYKYALIAASSSPTLFDWTEDNSIRAILNFNIQRSLI